MAAHTRPEFLSPALGIPEASVAERSGSVAGPAATGSSHAERGCRHGQLHPVDTYHGLRRDGWEPVPRVGDQGVTLVSTWNFREGRAFQPRCGLRPPPVAQEFAMRFYNQQHRFYCGVDRHARTMYLCMLDHHGRVVYDKNLAAEPDAFLKAVAPFRDDLVVPVECLFCC